MTADGGRFGSRRVFNTQPRNPHSGADYSATGPHLHFGLRWHGARVDPGLLLEPERATVVAPAA